MTKKEKQGVTSMPDFGVSTVIILSKIFTVDGANWTLDSSVNCKIKLANNKFILVANILN